MTTMRIADISIMVIIVKTEVPETGNVTIKDPHYMYSMFHFVTLEHKFESCLYQSVYVRMFVSLLAESQWPLPKYIV
jgi:hypothetical protein